MLIEIWSSLIEKWEFNSGNVELKINVWKKKSRKIPSK